MIHRDTKTKSMPFKATSSTTEEVLAGQAPSANSHPRVLIVAASPRIIGGQSVMAERLVSDLQADGIKVGFLPVDSLPHCLGFIVKIKYLRTLINTCFYLAFLVLRVWRYDVVQVFSASYWSFLISPVPAILVSKMYGKKIILHYHSGEAEDHLQRSGWLTHWLLKLPDEIVVPNQFLVNVFSRFNYQVSAIANNVDLSTFVFRARKVFHPKILVARSLEPLYNVSCAIRAFQIVKCVYPDAKLTILGTGSMRSQLEDEASALALTNVIFAGRVEHCDIPQLYRENDISLNTSSIDNMPVSILEAFASGLPVVTTAAGGIPFFVEHLVTGCLARTNDHRDVASQILALCRSPAMAAGLVQSGKRELQKHTWKVVGPQWIAMYYELCTPQRRMAT